MDNWIVVWNFRNRIEAEVAKSALESAGIESRIRADDAAGLKPHFTFTTSVSLMVHKDDEKDAKKLIEEAGLKP
jgi:hypothetical protein